MEQKRRPLAEFLRLVDASSHLHLSAPIGFAEAMLIQRLVEPSPIVSVRLDSLDPLAVGLSKSRRAVFAVVIA